MAKNATILGKVSITPKGVWNQDTVYERLDLVSFIGSSFLSVSDNNTSLLTDSTKWMVIANKGDKGDEGEKGDQGPVGPKGDKGDTGDKGEKGDQGVPGPVGPKGDKGDGLDYSTMTPEEIANITGKSAYDVAVENGYLGTESEWLVSLQGSKGEKGEPGAPGPAGPPGPKGDTGPMGPQGAPGPIGSVGPQGLKGDKGDTGAVGPQGIQGPAGVPGPKGDQGPANERLSIADTRSDNNLPNYYFSNYEKSVISEFKYCNIIGLDSLFSGTFCNVVTHIPWSDNSGGYPVQFATSNENLGRIAVRSAVNDTTWGVWNLLPLTSDLQTGPKGDTGPIGPQGIQGPQGAPGPQGPAGVGFNEGNLAKVNRLGSKITATTVAGLNVNYETILVTLSANASLSANLTGASYDCWETHVFVLASGANRTVTIPTTGSYISMCGSSVTIPSGKWCEFSLKCMGGIWRIAMLEQE